jgi:hypothetical protein
MARNSRYALTACDSDRPVSSQQGHDGVTFTAPNAVIILDGASQPDPSEHDGGWLADTLGREVCQHLAGDRDLALILGRAIGAVAQRYGLNPGSSPLTTVSIVRWDADTVDVLVLGDSPVVALGRDGRVREVRDERLHRIPVPELSEDGPGFGFDHRDWWRWIVDAERAHRNRPGGYWIGEAVPDAAAHAVRVKWNRRDLAAVLVMTDGVAKGVDDYGVPPDWPAAFTVASNDPGHLVDLVHDTEADDPDGTRWPRSKRHDDKAVALVQFGPP